MRFEIGDFRFEIGDLRLEIGDWRLEIGDWRFEILVDTSKIINQDTDRNPNR